MLKFRRRFFVAAAAALLVTCVPLARAQTTPSADAPPVTNFPDTAPPISQKPVATFHVTSNLVSLYFTARDKHNGLIPTLSRSDCSVYENKQPQTIKDFSAVTNLPLTLGILLDTSGSQMYLLQLEQQAGGQFLHQIMRPQDQAMVVTFDVDVDLAQDFTSNVNALTQALNHATINTAGGNGAGGLPGIGEGPVPTQGTPKGTLLYDAVAQVSRDKMANQSGRKALILLTDGEDEGSVTTANEAIEDAQRANEIVYVILIADPSEYGYGYGYGGFGYTGAAQMRKLAEATGGRVINVGNNGRKLQDAFDQIEAELRTQYLLSYIPTDTRQDGTFRRIQITCKGDVKIQARKGYYATSGGD